jgi:hypothetical protein
MSVEEGIPWQSAWEDVRCSITVLSDSMSAAKVTEAIGVEPTRQRIKGEPVSPKRPNIPVASHMWVWQVGDLVERSLDAQLDEIWNALGSHASKFKGLPSDAKVQLDIWITHRGSELSLGWALDRRHVVAAAAFGASINVDEYDDTGDEESR